MTILFDRMTKGAGLSERAVWQVACTVIERHGAGAADFIIKQLEHVLEDPVAVEDWRRIAAAIDDITRRARRC